ncbi:MAG: type IV fimbrial biogenesis protein FimT [Halieaceae bacterium]
MQHSKHINRHSGGLTLIELLIVLSIVAIATNIAAPAFVERINALRSASAMRHLATLLNFGRYHALTVNIPTTVCALDARRKCVRNWSREQEIAVFVDGNGNHRLDPSELQLRSIRWPMRGGELSWRASLARPYIEFETTGGTWQNGTLYYCPDNRDARHARSLVLSHSGRSYLPGDSNGDGIREDRHGRNLRC